MVASPSKHPLGLSPHRMNGPDLAALFAFIDESGDRGLGENASPHFALTASIIPEGHLHTVEGKIAEAKKAVGRHATHELSFKKLNRNQRSIVVSTFSEIEQLKIISVIVCKQYLSPSSLGSEERYLYPFRLLLERMSWFARENSAELNYTLAHIKGLRKSKLRDYEQKLDDPRNEIDWRYLNRAGGKLGQPREIPHLQLADTVASSIGAAFNPELNSGAPNQEYLRRLAKMIYTPTPQKMTSYGLKIHPWNHRTKEAYPWIQELMGVAWA